MDYWLRCPRWSKLKRLCGNLDFHGLYLPWKHGN
jgi:hypothetical protein